MEKDSITTMNRRSFLKAATILGVGAAGIGLAGCASTKTTEPAAETAGEIKITNTETVDIVVCGAGAAGISAAVRAAESGLKVVLLEKSTTVGGASLGIYSATVHQATDDISKEVNEWITDCHWRVDIRAISNLLHKSGEAFGWLTSDYGWEFLSVNSFGKPQQLIPFLGDPAGRVGLYEGMISKSGVDLRTSMTAKQLTKDEAGAITGVIAVDADGVATKFECKAAAIATGGYAGNFEMVKEASGFEGVLGGLPQNIGEGLEMAWAAGGAKPRNHGIQLVHQTLAPATDELKGQFEDFPAKYPFLTTYMPQFMNITAQGNRFRNEGIITSADAASLSSTFQGAFHYVVISKSQIDIMIAGGLAAIGTTGKLFISPDMAPVYELDTPWTGALEVFDAMAATEFGFKGDTPKALAEAAGIDPEVFVANFENYEKFCKDGVDTECGKEATYLIPMGEGPYYLVTTQQNNLSSWGGVATDIEYRVLDNTKKPIPGLYAIGVEAGSNLYNDAYVGVGIGVCLVYTSGYLAGQHMVDYISA
ncbi:MAG: FAD-binding protein [Actinobacteria bacterium]|nr:FAD-binding protein [Actinomycetota bacterium]